MQESASEYLHQREQFRLAEKTWIAEKERLLARCGSLKQVTTGGKNGRSRSALATTRISIPPAFNELPLGTPDGAQRRELELRRAIEDLEFQFDEQQKLAAMYREQVLY